MTLPTKRGPREARVRAYREAPWRLQTRALTMGLVAVLGVAAALSLFIFTGAQAAEAGLQVQRLIGERDGLLRKLEAQQVELAQLQNAAALNAEAAKLGFVPVAPQKMGFVLVPAGPAAQALYLGPAGVLYVQQGVALAPSYRETLLEWLLRMGGQIP